MSEIEQSNGHGNLITWLVVLGLAALMLARGIGSHWLIRDYGRSWDYVVAPYVPGEAYSSSGATPWITAAPRQMELPPSVRKTPLR
jgi:hypothetical protein